MIDLGVCLELNLLQCCAISFRIKCWCFDVFVYVTDRVGVFTWNFVFFKQFALTFKKIHLTFCIAVLMCLCAWLAVLMCLFCILCYLSSRHLDIKIIHLTFYIAVLMCLCAWLAVLMCLYGIPCYFNISRPLLSEGGQDKYINAERKHDYPEYLYNIHIF